MKRNKKTTNTIQQTVFNIFIVSWNDSGSERTRHEPPGVRVGTVGVSMEIFLNKLFFGVSAFRDRFIQRTGDVGNMCAMGEPNGPLFFGDMSDFGLRFLCLASCARASSLIFMAAAAASFDADNSSSTAALLFSIHSLAAMASASLTSTSCNALFVASRSSRTFISSSCSSACAIEASRRASASNSLACSSWCVRRVTSLRNSFAESRA